MRTIQLILTVFVVSAQSELNCPNGVLDISIRNYIETRHNQLRSLISRGGWALGLRGKNIYALQYNCTLETQAQAAADTCSGGSATGALPGTSENVFVLTGAGLNAGTFAVAIARWWEQSALNQMLRYTVFYSAAAQSAGLSGYAQIVWGATTLVGCGFRQCSGQGMVVCHYMTGRMVNQNMYETGQGCTDASQCTTFAGSTCNRAQQLCQKPANVDPIPPGSQTPATTAATSTETCTGSPLLQSIRNTIVNSHNAMRSRIARGLEVQGQSTRGCANMFAIKYDCSLEQNAQFIADKCDPVTFKADRGRNVYVNAEGQAAGVAVNSAIVAWQKEIMNFTETEMLSTSGPHNDVAVVGQFAQMAFWRTTAVGCGYAKCNDTARIVTCRYRAARGNTGRAYVPMTTTGCTMAKCTAVNNSASCNSSTGLCQLP